MKKLLLSFQLWLAVSVATVYAGPNDFITTWDLSKTGGGTNNQISFNAIVSSPGTTYTWESVSGSPSSGSGSISTNGLVTISTGLPANAIIRLTIVNTNFKSFRIADGTDKARLTGVSQWGTMGWTNISGAFQGCNNLTITATDKPVLTSISSMNNMFKGCSVLATVPNIGTWDTSKATGMNSMFRDASLFNDDLGDWATGLVTDMRYMFAGATAFNQDIGDWDVSKVTTTLGMFQDATAFNQDIGGWELVLATEIQSMFRAATAFNQNISGWDVSDVTDMSGMFYGATAFNQDISGWDVAKVTTMSGMFQNATAFNQNLGTWTFKAGVTLTTFLTGSGMDCPHYSASLIGWAGNASTPTGLSLGASGLKYGTNAGTQHDKLIALTGSGGKGWTITDSGSSGDICLMGSYFVTTWDLSKTGSGATQISFYLTVFGTGTTYSWETVPAESSGGPVAITTSNHGAITVTGLPAGKKIKLTVVSNNLKSFRIDQVTNDVDLGADRARLVEVNNWGGSVWNTMSGAFYGCNNLTITATDVPDLTGMGSMNNMFRGCSVLSTVPNIGNWDTSKSTNMNAMFRDTPLFNDNIGAWVTTNVTDMRYMFAGAAAFNQNIGSWNVAKLTSMLGMFQGATAFNQNIGGWQVGLVTDTEAMFRSATAFNQNIGSWDVSKVTNMNGMFYGASAFNQDISGWQVGLVTDMQTMFRGATAFNQNIGSWDVSKVTVMNGMFQSAAAFNQDIGSWNVTVVTTMQDMFRDASAFNQNLGAWTFKAGVTLTTFLTGSGMDCPHYSASLIGWAGNASTPTGLSLGASGLKYGTNAATQHDKLIALTGSGGKGWTITDSGSSGDICLIGSYFVTTWDLSKTGSGATQISFYLTVFGTGTTYSWETVPAESSGGPVAITTSNHGAITVTGLPAGKKIKLTVVSNNLKSFRIDQVTNDVDLGADRARLVEVNNWGGSVWNTMASAFYGCNNLTVTATDVPDLTGIGSMNNMFRGCSVLSTVPNIGNWDTSKSTNMNAMFRDTPLFNDNIGTWITTNVTDMRYMFAGAAAFNQNIGSWNVGKVTTMLGMFQGATAFNQNIGGWQVGLVTDTEAMFRSASAFNQNISSWDVSKVTNMNGMFYAASAFNQDISGWQVGLVTDMQAIFREAAAFNQDIGGWDVSKVVMMNNMFQNATAFNQDISGWQVGLVTDMQGMFREASAFNQDIGGWDVSKVTKMNGMFYNAVAFNQDIGSWNVTAVTNMLDMFGDATAFNQNLSAWTFNAGVILTTFLEGSGMDCPHYSASLIGWAENANTPTGLNLGALGLKYGTNAATQHDNLITVTGSGGKGWTITDGGSSGGACLLSSFPVTLISFAAQESAEGVALHWETTSEVGASHFEIERSADAKSFVKTGRVEALGNSTELHQYTFFDGLSGYLAPVVYYRLRSVDLDESFSLSRVIALRRRKELLNMAIYPNPVSKTGKLTVELGASEVQVSLLDMLGRKTVFPATNLINGKAELDLRGIGSGFYIIQIQSSKGSASKKLVVN